MEITIDILKTIYERAKQFAITKYGNEPDRIEIEDGGTICARWINYHCSEIQEDTEYISADDLTLDLDAIAKERAIRLEEERIKRIAYEKERERQYKAQEKEKRKQKYIELKKEFE